MTCLLVPNTPEVAFSTQRVRLEGRDYNIDFSYNQRADRWSFSIRDDESTPLVMGVTLVCKYPLLNGKHYDERLPPGEFFCMSLTADQSPPGFKDLGADRRCQLNYFDAATIARISP